jgi:hypothetical protein
VAFIELFALADLSNCQPADDMLLSKLVRLPTGERCGGFTEEILFGASERSFFGNSFGFISVDGSFFAPICWCIVSSESY